ncbi:hypothetical protein Ciccas_004431 [Cichlidogyrus casuarinus]|uniref:Uncharacterized protein n=1 Tax=Cichlidogyrus casuarinus TaxID=1844966 RepID=A0ABD2QBL0_9PLAT
MLKAHRDILITLHIEFVNDLEDIDGVIDHLFAQKIISADQKETLSSDRLQRNAKARKLMDLIPRRGPRAFEVFKNALEATCNDSLIEMIKEREANSDISTDAPSFLLEPLQLLPTTKQVTIGHVLEPYTVKSSPRGAVLIINIDKYSQGSAVKDRFGSKIDLDAIKNTFIEFEYDVIIRENIISDNFIAILRQFLTSERFRDLDAAGVVIMTHGLEKHIYAADGQLIPISSIVDCFSNKECPVLASKPKFLIFQACRGELKNHSSVSEVSADFIEPSSFNKVVNTRHDLPYLSDCVFAYSTLPGFVSWRQPEEGSLFIQTLVEVIKKYGQQMHFLDLLTEVNRTLINKTASDGCKQISQPATTLTRPFFLSTKEFF